MTIFDRERILLIAPQHKATFSDYKAFGYNMLPIFRSENIILRVVREIFFRLHLPFQSLFFTPVPCDYDRYILYDILVTKEYIKYIADRIPAKKLILFLDNIIGNRIELIEYCKQRDITVVSLDKGDVEKYNLLLIEDFYNKEYCKDSLPTDYDVLFVGRDKGRLSYLLSLEREINSQGLRTYFHITKSSRLSRGNPIYKKTISYQTLLSYVSRSKAILEVLQEGQTSLTLRAMESLYFKKKLITTSRYITSYRFYDPANIFVLGVDNINRLKDFINQPYNEVSQEIVDYYEYRNVWTRMIDQLETTDIKESIKNYN